MNCTFFSFGTSFGIFCSDEFSQKIDILKSIEIMLPAERIV